MCSRPRFEGLVRHTNLELVLLNMIGDFALKVPVLIEWNRI
jgi:hypothetical protein